VSLVIFSFKDFLKGYGHIQDWGMMEISIIKETLRDVGQHWENITKH
jgi:hypothetical protein